MWVISPSWGSLNYPWEDGNYKLDWRTLHYKSGRRLFQCGFSENDEDLKIMIVILHKSLLQNYFD